MKKIIKYILAIFLIIIIQVSIVNNGVIFNIKTNLLLVLTIYISHLYGLKSGACFGILTGLIYDILLSPVIGISSFSLFIISIIVSYLRSYIFSESLVLYIIYIIVFNLLYVSIIFLIAYLISLPVTFNGFLSAIVSEVSINNFISIIILDIIYKNKRDLLQVYNIER